MHLIEIDFPMFKTTNVGNSSERRNFHQMESEREVCQQGISIMESLA